MSYYRDFEEDFMLVAAKGVCYPRSQRLEDSAMGVLDDMVEN